jgi:hypothetical protein
MIVEIDIMRPSATTAADLRAAGWSERLIECFENHFGYLIRGKGE